MENREEHVAQQTEGAKQPTPQKAVVVRPEFLNEHRCEDGSVLI